MPKWVDTEVMNKGLEHLQANCNQMMLIETYAQGDSYAVVTGNDLGNVAMAVGDFTLGDQGVYGRQIAVASKSTTASRTSALTPDLHIALLDTVNSRVLAVTNEQSDQPITISNPLNIPAWNINCNQP